MAWSPSDSTCRSSCVKIYLCSNPEDSVVERRFLREKVFPELRDHCRHTRGLDFRVIDPFESSDPRRWPDECSRRQLIKECRESSAGPFLLALIGHQYGTARLPIQVEVSEFQLLLRQSQAAGVSSRELERVYQREENTIPPSYCLRPPHRSTGSPEVSLSKDQEIEVKAEEENLLKLLQDAVTQCVHCGLMSREKAQRYYRSAVDADLRFALDSNDDDVIGRCLVYINKVINAERQKEEEQTEPQSQFDMRAAPTDGQLLSQLCDNFLPGLVTSCHHLLYTTSTLCDPRCGYSANRRRLYADTLCRQVNSDLMGLIDNIKTSKTKNQQHVVDVLSREQAEQQELCAALAQLYDVVRPEEEEEVRVYVKQCDKHCPLVVSGGPCTGKTVLLAHCAQQIESWLPDCHPVVITYFCNYETVLSPSHMLSRLCFRIVSRYSRDASSQRVCSFDQGTGPDHLPQVTDTGVNGDPDWPTSKSETLHRLTNVDSVSKVTPTNSCSTRCPEWVLRADVSLTELGAHFRRLLSNLPSSKQPLVLILSGLDQIQTDSRCLPILECLPSPLPPAFKLILTVFTGSTQILRAVRAHYVQPRRRPSESESPEQTAGYVSLQLGPADRKERGKLLVSLLRSSGRRVTSGQQCVVNRALTSCGRTLYVRLLHLHTSLWCSDSDVTESSLPVGIHASIAAFLDHLEKKHGSSLVAHAVCYLTLSRCGLTEVDLAGLLSTDNGVLSEYVQQGVRLSQVEVERLLLDLRRFLIPQSFEGSVVFQWMSRHFGLVAAKKYLSSQEKRREIHSKMADFLSCRSSGENTEPPPVRTGSGPRESASRLSSYSGVFSFSSQCDGQTNLRKLIELPYHLQQSHRWEELECSLLMSLEFHQAMVRVGLLQILVTMLQESRPAFRFLRERQLIAGALMCSAHLLQHVPLQLPEVMETNLFPFVDIFPELREYVSEIRRQRRSGGNRLGVVLFPAPATVPPIQSFLTASKNEGFSVAGVAVTQNGVVAAVMDDGSARVWKDAAGAAAKVTLSREREDLKFLEVKSSGRSLLFSTQCNKFLIWDVTGPEKFTEVEDHEKQNPGLGTTNILAGFVECQKTIFVWWQKESYVAVYKVDAGTSSGFRCQSFVTCLTCSSDGRYVYCGQEDGTVSVFDSHSCCLLGSSSSSTHNVVTLIIVSGDRREVAGVDMIGNVALWDRTSETEPLRLVKEVLIKGEPKNVLNHDYSEETSTLLVCQSHQVTLWDTCEWEIWDHFLPPQGRFFTQAVLSQVGHLFLALLENCVLVLAWSIRTGDCVLSLEAAEKPRTLLKTDTDLICVARDGSLTVWDDRMIDAAGTIPKTRYGVKEVLVGQIGEHFYTTDGSEKVWKWSLEAGVPQANFVHDGPVEKTCLSSDNVYLVTLSADNIYVWQTETGQNVLRISDSAATDVLISPNNNLGVSVSKQGLSRVWRLTHGSVVCAIHLHLSCAKVSPESTFLIGFHGGDLLAASLWCGSVNKRFSRAESSERAVAFHTVSEQPDFVVVMAASGAVFTWNVGEETVCKHFQLPFIIHCQLPDFQMSSDARYALLSTDHNTVQVLDLCQGRVYSFKAPGPVFTAGMDKCGSLVAYISLENICVSDQRTWPVLTVVRLSDGERVGSVCLSKSPLSLVVCQQQCVYVGFQDGSVCVFSASGNKINKGKWLRENENLSEDKRCPCDSFPLSFLHLDRPNVSWT